MILDRFKDYVDNDKLEIHIYESCVYLINYTLVSNFSNSKIELKKNDKKISILGNNLIISKLKKEEILITGDIYEVVLR